MAKQRILVVDDHDPLLTAIQGILEGEGYTVLTAINGEQALEVMEQARPDLIMADIMMPRMDGYALYKAVRARPEWVPIPFIFLTAKAEREDKLRGIDMGAEDYLTKPFDTQELVVAVRSRLGRAQAIGEAIGAEFEELKQQIVTILGHELRTPLTYVRGYTELALEEVPSLSADEIQEFLQGIKRGADRLNRLVENMMLMVQLDSGRIADEFCVLAIIRHDLGALLASTLKKYKEEAAAAGVTLELEVESDLPPVRICEPYFMDAVGRLVENGIKFSLGKGKQVTVSARCVDGWIEVSVADERPVPNGATGNGGGARYSQGVDRPARG
jgi:two-component system sensor histidine kinase/response regulator